MFSRYLKNEKGVAIVLFAMLITLLMGFGAIAVDVGRVILEQTSLQNAVDATTLAAAQELPDTVKATAKANEYIAANGYAPADITIMFSNSNKTMTIEAKKILNYTFARVIGFDNKMVRTSAAAQTDGIGDSFNYALFSGGLTNTLSLNGSNMYIGGSSHSNKNFSANGSQLTITGACEAKTTISINGSSINIPTRVPNAPFVPMPDFSEIIKQQAEKAGTLYTGNKTFNGSNMNVEESIYVNGNVTINGSRFTGKGCVLATGSITFNGSNLNATSNDAVCFYTKTGNITINGSSQTFEGILYAPNGNINMNGSSQTVRGRVIGKSVTINGSSLLIQSGTNEMSSLPSKGVKLIR